LHVNTAGNGKRYTLHAHRWLLIVFEKSYVKNGMPEKIKSGIGNSFTFTKMCR
jgi:hypothetical protein